MPDYLPARLIFGVSTATPERPADPYACCHALADNMRAHNIEWLDVCGALLWYVRGSNGQFTVQVACCPWCGVRLAEEA